jgi:hypothetical protein
VFVLADAADQPVAVRGQPVDDGPEVVDFKATLRSPSSLAIAVGDPGSWWDVAERAVSTSLWKRVAANQCCYLPVFMITMYQ